MAIKLFTAAFAAMALAACAQSPSTSSSADAVLVFGATGGTGLATVRRLREQNVPVTAFVRPTSNREKLEPMGVSFVVGDALSLSDVDQAMADGNFAAVVSAIGGRPGQPRPDYTGVKNMVDAAKRNGVGRMVLVSSIGAGDAARAKPPADAGFFKTILHEKTLGEDYLIASGLEYTVIRPGGLRTEPATGNGQLSVAPAMGMIHREDVGALIVQALGDPSAVGKVYHAIDPNLKRESEER
ncbi:MAG: SDR family oxidoreductase [Lysobacterales bacterium]